MEGDHLHHSNGHKKLNFNASLLSTRRHPSPNRVDSNLWHTASQGSSDRAIPFSWEQAPGKPKELFIRTREVLDQTTTPRLKAPPCWSPRPPLHPPNEDFRRAEGFDGDDDDENDVDSLSEAIDIVERAKKGHKLDTVLKLKLEEYERETPSPSFMIERFLPDATALATSSALRCSSNGSHGLPVWRTKSYAEKSTTAGEPCASPKGCGLQILLPNWRIKRRLCGMKSPVREGFVSLQNPCRPKQKKHYQN